MSVQNTDQNLSDRLALMYFNDTEVWRTSTAEPTTAPGIRWTYLKDMTEYLSLWNAPQKIIFGKPFFFFKSGNCFTNDVYHVPGMLLFRQASQASLVDA